MALRAGFHGTVGQPSAQVIDGSLKFNAGTSEHLKRTPGSASNRRTWTWSAWVKRTVYGADKFIFSAGSDASNQHYLRFKSNNTLEATEKISDSTQSSLITNAVHRDTGWYHLVYVFDSTQSASSDRVCLYVNGVKQTSLSTNTYPSLNHDTYINNNSAHYIGSSPLPSAYYDGSISQVYLIDGQALGPEYFGFTDPLTNTWRPKKAKTDGPNVGTTWSSVSTISSGGAAGGKPLSNGFDGSISNAFEGDTSGATVTVPVSATIVKGGVKVYAAVTSGNPLVVLLKNGGTTVETINAGASGGQFYSSSTYSGPITSLVISRTGRAPEFNAIGINGIILKDDSTTNLDFGTNGFYLPMDGNSPIGQDKSGNGNDWIPVNLSSSNFLDKATGALPILNTTPGGVSASVGVRTDANANSLALALPLVSDLNAVTNQINSGASNRTILSHNSPVSSTTKSNFYGRSYYLNGSQAITIGDIGTDLQFGSDDFTMEIWFNSNTTLDASYWNPIVSFPWHGGNNDNSQLWIGFAGGAYSPYSTGELHARIKTASGIVELPSGILTAYNDNAWHHVAITRSGSTASIYFDGALRSTASISGSLNTSYGSYEAFIGAYDHGGGGLNSYFKGYVSDFRVYKGVAKYTSNFIPASTDPDILPDTPSGVSGGSKLVKITDGAVAFNGSDEYLSVADDADFTVGSNPFTIEFYAYKNESGEDFFCGSANSAGADVSMSYSVQTGGGSPSNSLRAHVGDGSSLTTVNSGVDFPTKRWVHVAFVRDGNTLRLFQDGVQMSTTSFSGTVKDSADPFMIGRGFGANSTKNFPGFISNFRFIKGTALYTSNFTPPSAPLTNVTNTKLLCCQSNTSAVDTAVVPGTAPNTRNWSARSNWNSGGTLTNASSYPLTAAFDGNLNTTFAMSYAGGMIWTAPATISFSSSIEVYVNSSIGTGGQGFIATISGVQQSKVDLNAAGSWETLYSGSGTFDKLEITRNNGGNNNNLWISAIRVDGTVLVDAIAGHGDAAATNFNPFITDINTVRGQETGYPTWNPLRVSSQTLSNNNMTTTGASGNVLGSMFTPTSGKFYWEVTAGSDYTMTGIQRENNYDMSYPGNSAGQIAMYLNTGVGSGQLYEGGSITSSWGGGVTGDIIGVALDMDNNKVYFYNNGRGLGAGGFTETPEAVDVPTGGGYTANCRSGSGAYDGPSTINFGQKPFKFPPPDGFQPLNAANVRPETVIARPDQYVGISTWTGDSAASRNINIGMKPDLVWLKNRFVSGRSHYLYDSVRGFGANKEIVSNTTDEEGSNNHLTQNHGYVSGNTINGFTLTAGATNSNYTNQSGQSYVAWAWKAGGNKGTFNVDDVGYANASDVSMDVGGIRVASTVSSGNDYSAGYAGHSPAGTWVDSDSWSGLPAYSSGQKGYFSGTETLSNGSVISAAANPKPFNAVANGSQGFVLRASTTVTLKLLVQGNVTEIATTSSDSQTFGNRTIVATNPTSGTYVEATGKCFWWSGNSNLPSISIMGTLYDAPAQPSIASTGCSVGTKQGFSIIKYTGSGNAGDSVSHGLLESPKFIITKNIDNGTYSWRVFTTAIDGSNDRLLLDGTNNKADQTDAPIPTSSVFYVGANLDHNKANDNIIAYLWHDVPGLQKFGVYEGNSQPTDGNYIHLGFSPAILIIKDIDSTGYWYITDSERNPTNDTTTSYVWVNSNAAEQNDYSVDLLSDGFDLYASSGNLNATRTYIYAAWAEAPQFNLYGGQSNAR